MATLIELDAATLRALMQSAPVRDAIEEAAEKVADEVRAYISRPAPRPRPRKAYNPPPGPPMVISEDLINSIEVTEPIIDPGGGFDVDIIATAEHRGVEYGQVLRDRGYRFHPRLG